MLKNRKRQRGKMTTEIVDVTTHELDVILAKYYRASNVVVDWTEYIGPAFSGVLTLLITKEAS